MGEYRSFGKTQDGYTEEIHRSCLECKHMRYKVYTAQSDSGSIEYCAHPEILVHDIPRHMTSFNTPKWCPVLVKKLNEDTTLIIER